MAQDNKEQSDKVKAINVYNLRPTFNNPIKDVGTARA